jgi:hypothetical protein
VYFGTESPPPLVGNQAGTGYDPGGLAGGTVYYWKVDAVEADGTTVHPGAIWSFKTTRPGVGSILREVWEGIGGTAVSNLTSSANYPDNPTWSDQLPKMDSRDFGDNYGGRLIGMLAPEISGDYTFWILSDDASQLWLSTSGKGCDAELIAWITGCCGNYDTDEERESDPIYLEGGQTYPIWALWKEGGGGDYCRVAWQGPDAPSRTEIDGYYLMPGSVFPAATGPSPADGATGVDMSPTLSWKPALDAVSYEVYVDGALVASTTDTSVPAGPFALSDDLHPSTHTWRVDVINPAGTVTGCDWSFTVADNRVIDDFESYDAVPEAIAPQMVVMEPVAPPEQEIIGGDYTIPGYTVVAEAPPDQESVPEEILVEALAPDDACLVAHYEFENDTTDSSGNGHDGTYDGVPVYVAGAPDGLNPAGAIQFDGQGPQRVEVHPFDVVGSGIGIACWFKTSNLDTPGSDPRMISKAVGGAGDEHWFMISSSRVGSDKVLRFRLKTDDGTTGELKAGAPDGIIPLDVWTHVVATWDGSTMRLYKDGVEVGSMAKTGTAVATDPDLPMAIGNQPSITDPRPWDGLIDDVRIYNCALTEGNARYLAGLGSVVQPAYYRPLLVHYAMDEGAGDVAQDSSGNGLDGVISGATWTSTTADGSAACLDFSGLGDNVVSEAAGPYLNDLAGLSISLWIQSDLIDTDKGFIIGSDPDGTDQRGIRYDTSGASGGGDDVIKYGVACTDGADETESSVGIQTTEWQHIAMVWDNDGTGTDLYINGVMDVKSFDGTNRTGLTAGYTKLLVGKGSKDTAADAGWDGRIDDVRVYDYRLSEGNVRYLAGVGDRVVDPVYVPPVYGPMELHVEFEGDATDSSGNDRDGTLMGDAQFEPGPVGQALLLDGDGDYVNVDGYKGINMVDGVQQAFTIANWFKTTGNGEMVTWGSSPGRQRLTWRIDGGRLRTEHGAGNLRGRTYVNDDEWHHGALVVTEGANLRVPNTRLYLDGMEDGIFSGSDNPYELTAGADVCIGCRADNKTRWFPGSIDDVRIYDYPLSQGEIRYLAGAGNVYGPMRLHLEFEGDLTDSSGNNLHGTAYGAVGFETDPVMGEVVSLPGGDNQFVEITNTGIKGNDPTTIACWAKADHTSIPDWSLIFGFTTQGGNCGSHFNIGSLGGPGGVGAHSWCWEETIFSDTEALEWHHYAMTYDGTTIGYFGDGKYMDTDPGKSNVQNLWRRSSLVHVGSRITHNNSFPGKVDDARIYDYVLTDAQIASLAGATADNPISDTWSDLGLIDFSLAGGTMQMNTYALPGLPYYVGEVSRALPFADLTEGGGTALSAWVRGDPANIALLMYMSVADADGQSADAVYDGDLTNDDWVEWNVDMAAELAGVDVTNAADIAIGVAGLDGGVVADAVDVDNIRVYASRCFPDIVQPVADLNDDCVVNVDDLMILAAYWGNSGVWYEYYPEPPWIFGDDIQNAPFDTTTPRKEGPINNFDIGIREQNDRFGFRFTGLIEVPVDGDYTFYTSSDDGSFLDIGDTRVVENYGWHGMQWREGTINLTAGRHPITVAMFEDGGGEGLETEYAGPGIDRQPIPDDVLYLDRPSPYDLSGDGDIDWMDVILMLTEWLDEELWP